MNWKKLTSREVRKSLYLISLAVIPLLVFYGVITEDSAPLWVALVQQVYLIMAVAAVGVLAATAVLASLLFVISSDASLENILVSFTSL